MLDASYHRRRVTERMGEPEYRAEYQRMSREIAQVNEVMRALNELREQGSMSKAELARVIGRNDAVVRRFFTAQSNPELRTIAAMAEALDADIRIVPRRKTARRRATAEVVGERADLEAGVLVGHCIPPMGAKLHQSAAGKSESQILAATQAFIPVTSSTRGSRTMSLSEKPSAVSLS